MEEKIVLDKDTFKALSQDNRINILKLLSERNHTLSEIADALSYSNSTVKEHLDVMVKAGLIKQIDSGHKWKYYKLTFKGRNVVDPREVKVLFAFLVSAFAAVSVGLYMMRSLFASSNEMFMAKSVMVEDAVQEAAPMAARMAVKAEPVSRSIDPTIILLIILGVSILVLGLSGGYLLKKKKVIITEKKNTKKGEGK